MGRIKHDISIIISILSLVIAMIVGLVIDARPEIILIRASLSLFVSAVFILLLGSVIEKFSKKPQNPVLDHENLEENETSNENDKISTK